MNTVVTSVAKGEYGGGVCVCEGGGGCTCMYVSIHEGGWKSSCKLQFRMCDCSSLSRQAGGEGLLANYAKRLHITLALYKHDHIWNKNQTGDTTQCTC